jgi:hypothetical protein
VDGQRGVGPASIDHSSLNLHVARRGSATAFGCVDRHKSTVTRDVEWAAHHCCATCMAARAGQQDSPDYSGPNAAVVGSRASGEPAATGRGGRVVSAIEGVKRHWVVAVLVALGGTTVFMSQVVDVAGEVSGVVHDWRNPHEEDYQRLAELDLGVTPDYLEDWLGEARRSADLCKEMPCPAAAESAALTMNLYESELVAVRAIFEGSSLKWYAVTLLSDELKPPITWLGHDLGTLGKATYAEALNAPGVEPTDVNMFLGPQSSAYVEVVAAGAPADYRGLILASAPTGWSGKEAFDYEAAQQITRLNDAAYDSSVAMSFRSSSRPNTFGEFVDDGELVSMLARDTEQDRAFLYMFTSV